MKLTADQTQFCRTIADMIISDNAQNDYVDAKDDDRGNFIETYMLVLQKRVEHMQTKYITDTEFQKMFRLLVYGMIKYER